MPSHIVKPRQDEDYYVEWSSVVEAPTFHGTRAEMVAYGERNWPSVVSERITRADATSCSALWYEPSWSDDEAYILMQAGWFPRSRMREVVAAFLDAGENVRDPRVLALLEPFEPDPVSAKSGEGSSNADN